MTINLSRLSFPMHEIRAKDDNGKRTIAGHAAVFDSPSSVIQDRERKFVEVIRRGAFTSTIRTADVRCLFNHDADHVLGRTRSGTLRLAEDARGLAIECDMPDTSTGRDVYESIRRGDIDQMSFGFRVAMRDGKKMEKWNWPESRQDGGGIAGLPTRELLEVELVDVSPVTFPAYEDTDVAARCEDHARIFDAARRARLDPADVDRRLRLAMT